jgi:hypothetical protein
MRSSIILKIFIAFIIVSLVPVSGYIAYNDWANRRIVYDLQTSKIINDARQFARVLDGNIVHGKERIESKKNEIMLCNKYREEMYRLSESLPDEKHLKMCFEMFPPRAIFYS